MEKGNSKNSCFRNWPQTNQIVSKWVGKRLADVLNRMNWSSGCKILQPEEDQCIPEETLASLFQLVSSRLKPVSKTVSMLYKGVMDCEVLIVCAGYI